MDRSLVKIITIEAALCISVTQDFVLLGCRCESVNKIIAGQDALLSVSVSAYQEQLVVVVVVISKSKDGIVYS